MNSIEQCQSTIQNLDAKLARVKQRSAEISAERDASAFAAHAGGDAKARAKLDKLTDEALRQNHEMASLEAALKTARQHLAEAEHAEATAEDRAKAQAAHKLMGELSDACRYLDQNMEAAAKALIAIERGITELHELGFASPSAVQLRLGVVQAIQSWAHLLPRSWHDAMRNDGLAFLPPGQRRGFLQYWQSVAPSLGNAIRQRLGNAPVTSAKTSEPVA
jgi:hypothetical protein